MGVLQLLSREVGRLCGKVVCGVVRGGRGDREGDGGRGSGGDGSALLSKAGLLWKGGGEQGAWWDGDR